MTESAGTSQAGAAAPNVERLIAARNKLVIAVRDLRGGYPARQDDVDLAIAELDIEIVKVRGALSAAHTREAEQQEGLAKIGELLQTGGMTDAHYLAGAVRAALEREAVLRAENERLRTALTLARTYIREVRAQAIRNAIGAIRMQCDSVLPDIDAALAAVKRPPTSKP